VERELVTVKRQPPVGMEETYRSLFAPLMRVALLMTGSNTAAEDAVHDVFVRCADRLDDLDHPPTYLRAAVVNECRAQHRRRQRARRLDAAPAAQLPEELVETLDALDRLTPRRRAAVVLRYFVDIHDDEIAQILGCRPATVRSLIRRALTDLREALQ